MKKILIILILTIATTATQSFAQCGEPLLKQALKEMGDGQYIKDFSVDLKKENKTTSTGFVKFSIILNSRSHYKFNVADSNTNPEQAIIQLYDGDNLLASNLDKGKTYKSFEVIIGKTKVYNLVISYRGGVEGCSAVVQSLIKQYTIEEMK
jgi:hypothetical protein